MVKRRKNNTKKRRNGKAFKENGAKAGKTYASTVYETCTDWMLDAGNKKAEVEGRRFQDPLSSDI